MDSESGFASPKAPIEAMGERLEREAQTLLGRASFQRDNWEPLLFSRFIEAFEVTASQRGAECWQWPGLAEGHEPRGLAADC